MNSSKIISVVVIVAVLVLGSWWYFKQRPEGTPVTYQNPSTTKSDDANATNQNTVLAKNSSDAALDQDIKNIDAEMSSLDTDSANVDAGLNDKPVSQAE